ncbi:D-aminoacyl-tRNA deacylase [Hylemonella gracilis]|uniref:D-aminoacyl-tRNA deacylase n=1 Tax=Hylemonella gracilis ATCC 19624 TaxID=887062 RepID=F3KUD9_9BURK|nr:D-aminoacyl-tRNA deacylase [Hylemonella gracilis]EGI76689.1 D-tyrosyL-tRNA(tyr) deacylase [Hylemonella gracilis ATCC 19624]
MLALLQRVKEARVDVAGQTIGSIQQGLLVLLCAERGDSEVVADKLLAKILKLRIFSDEGAGAGPPQAGPAPSGGSEPHAVGSVGANRSGKMNKSLVDVGGGLLVVSQFTLAADTSSGNRPSFTNAAPQDEGRRLYDYFVAQAKVSHPMVQTGQFAADMQVSLVNDGPVTIPIWMK